MSADRAARSARMRRLINEMDRRLVADEMERYDRVVVSAWYPSLVVELEGEAAAAQRALSDRGVAGLAEMWALEGGDRR